MRTSSRPAARAALSASRACRTLHTGASLWGRSGEAEGSSAFGVNRFRDPDGFPRISTDTGETKTEGSTHRVGRREGRRSGMLHHFGPTTPLPRKPCRRFPTYVHSSQVLAPQRAYTGERETSS